MTTAQRVHWNGALQPESVEALAKPGGVIVSPTKVGYIIMATDAAGLDRKFDAKERKRNKPGVVLCGSMEQLRALAELNDEIDAFYQAHWDRDILLGCILPWRDAGRAYIPGDGSDQLMMDTRGTSCFVIKYGRPSEHVAAHLWSDRNALCFASSANPSGKGNRGLVEGIGERIASSVDVIVAANDYVASMQPESDVNTRYEQGVMVSMVDDDGTLIPEQKGSRDVRPVPVLIRKGLAVDSIMSLLSEHYTSWDYRQGQYY